MATNREREARERRFVSAKDMAEKQKGFELACIKLPPGVSRFSFREEKTYRVNLMCYEVKKKRKDGGNPNCDVGCCTYERTFYVHPNIGPNNESHCCLAKNWGERCPVCEAPENTDKPKKRQLILLKEKGDDAFQVYEGPHFNGLGGLLDEKIDATEDEDHPYRRHYYPKGGMTLAVKITKSSFTAGARSGTFMKPTNIEMEPRKDFSDDVIDEAPDLDEMLVKLPYDDLKELFYGGVEKEANKKEEEDKTRTTSRRGDDGPGPQPPTGNGRNRMRTPEPEPEKEPEERPSRRESRGDEGRTDARGSNIGGSEYKVGDFVFWDSIQWSISRINRNGTLDLEDDDGNIETDIAAADVQRIRVRGRSEEGTVPTPTKPPVVDEPKEDEDDAPAPRRGPGRPRKN